MLQNCGEDELNMIRIYTKYWNEHSHILTEGDFRPSSPLANYPIQKVVKDGFTIFGVHDDFVVSLDAVTKERHFLNAQLATEIVVKSSDDFGSFKGVIFDCQGAIVSETEILLSKGPTLIKVPPCGLAQPKRLKNTR